MDDPAFRKHQWENHVIYAVKGHTRCVVCGQVFDGRYFECPGPQATEADAPEVKVETWRDRAPLL